MLGIKDKEHKIALHGVSESTDDYGLSVQDELCFKKIIELFSDSIRDETNSTVHMLGDFSLLIRKKRSLGKYGDEDEGELKTWSLPWLWIRILMYSS